jgi:hypothetical protein
MRTVALASAFLLGSSDAFARGGGSGQSGGLCIFISSAVVGIAFLVAVITFGERAWFYQRESSKTKLKPRYVYVLLTIGCVAIAVLTAYYFPAIAVVIGLSVLGAALIGLIFVASQSRRRGFRHRW